MKSWDGNERRKDDMSQEERDLLIRIDTNLKNLVDKFTEHIDADNMNFSKQSIDIEWLKKTTYMGLGALIIINVILKFLK